MRLDLVDDCIIRGDMIFTDKELLIMFIIALIGFILIEPFDNSKTNTCYTVKQTEEVIKVDLSNCPEYLLLEVKEWRLN